MIRVYSHSEAAERFAELYERNPEAVGTYAKMMNLGYVRISLCGDFHVNYGSKHGINPDQARAVETIASEYDNGHWSFEVSDYDGDYDGGTDFDRFRRNLRNVVRQSRNRKETAH